MKDEKKNLDEFDDLEGAEIVTLYDEELKKEIDFEQVAAVEYKEKLYVFLTPVEPSDEIGEGEVIIMEVAEDDKGEETLLPVDDEDLLNEIFEEFQKEMECEDDECGCGCCGDDDEKPGCCHKDCK